MKLSVKKLKPGEEQCNVEKVKEAARGRVSRCPQSRRRVARHRRNSNERAFRRLAQLSPFHFSGVFKQATGMTPLQFVTRERLQAQQLIRETSRSLIEIALELGYASPSHFAQVFRRVVGMAPTQFRNAL